MNLLVFGIGKFFEKRKSLIESNGDSICAFIDNRGDIIKEFQGKYVYTPSEVVNLKFDAIVLMSVHCKEMRDQLINLKVKEGKIYSWEKYMSLKKHGEIKLFIRERKHMRCFKKILIITTVLNYNGASIAAIYAAKALQDDDYDVTLLAPEVCGDFIEEVYRNNLRLLVAPSYPYVSVEELDMVRLYDLVIVNVYQMIKAAYEISHYKPVLWWIHEPSDKYENIYYDTIKEFKTEHLKINDSDIYVCAVSDIARFNFNINYNNRVNALLPFGIPDENKELNEIPSCVTDRKVVFAIIGSLNKRKGIDILVDAISMMEMEKRNMAEFWIIGSKQLGVLYYESVLSKASNYPEIIFKGELNRESLNTEFKKIDVVICASREETMSMTIIEGMMHGKVCITTDATGIAEYMEDNVNGFVCEAGSPESLCKKISYILDHKNEMSDIAKNARKTYEERFSMETFGQNLEIEILNCEKFYNMRRNKDVNK